ncbi:MAG: BspA family leucine-rich repeat surface protein [Bacteroidales bacterium]|nr:BspA family leucine-rich repeat surface protein [Bacteroidales bacterium]
MKKLIFIFITVLMAALAARADVTINATNFPDANFRNYLMSEYPSGTITTAQLNARTELVVESKYIYDAKGVEYFTQLTKLDFYNNKLTSIDVSALTKLTYLNLGKNKLTSINVDNNTALEQLYLQSNQLTSVTVEFLSDLRTLWVSQNPNLTNLECASNDLNNFDIYNCTALQNLSCFNNPHLSTIYNLESCTALTHLDCEDCAITELPGVANMTNLQTLWACNNQLTSLNVSSLSQLKKLNVSGNTSLTELDCSECNLTLLDVTGCTALSFLNCNYNQLTDLDISGCTGLELISAHSNQIASMNVSNCPNLKTMSIYYNCLTGNAMGNLIAGLPTRSGDTGKAYVFVDPNPDSGSTDEGNVITAALINQASAKHWDLYHYNWSNSSWVPYTGAAAVEAYACYTPSNTTLTFYYDNQRSSRTGTTYDLNTGNYSPGWYTDGTYSNVSEVKFDPSFTNARPTTCHSWFRDMAQLQTIYGLNYMNTSAVTHMVSMFRGCSSLTVLDLSSFNTANVIAMGGMFMGCSNLRTIYAGSGWSTAAVEASAGMFYSCTSLVGGQGTTFNSSHVGIDYAHIDGGPSNPGYFTEKGPEAYACYTPSNTTLTFYYDTQRSSRTGTTYDLNTGSNDTGWDTDGTRSYVTKVVFDASFAGARPTTTRDWFYGMTNLQSITGMEYLNTSEVIYMNWMFMECSKLTSLDVSHFNTSKVTHMNQMFYGCTGLTSLDLSSFNTSQVIFMNQMFYGCTGLTSLDLSSFNTSNVTIMRYMFEGSTLLRTIYVGSGWSTAAVTNSVNMFNNCTSLVGGQGTTWNDSNPKDKTYAHIDGGPSNPGYFTAKNAGLRGDVNGDGSVNISDVTALIDYLLSGNASGINLSGADCNQDSSVNISDVTALIDYLLAGNW